MGIITRMRKQVAVYWAPLRIDSQGRAVLDAPVEIACRWDGDDKTAITDEGDQRTINAIVYVDRIVLEKGYLWEGALEDAPPDPLRDPDAFEIRHVKRNPNFRNTETLITVTV